MRFQTIALLLPLVLLVSQSHTTPVKCPHAKHHNVTDASLEKSTARVVNGVPVTDQNEYPFVVDLSKHPLAISSTRFCTGTLINERIVLTAAHCVLNDGYDTSVFATVGRIELDDNHHENTHARTFRAVASIAHPSYDGLASPNDVALILLNSSSDAPTVKLSKSTPNQNDQAWVVGYGIQKMGTLEQAARRVAVLSGRLQKTALRIKKRSFCDLPEAQIKTAAGMLCTEGVKEGSSACQGDSGGGLFLKRSYDHSVSSHKKTTSFETVQVGIVSYGDAKCASEDSGVFTDVSSVHSWIISAMEKLENAFLPTQLRMDDHTTRHVVQISTATFNDPDSSPFDAGAIGFYHIRTHFSSNRHVTVSLCNEPAGHKTLTLTAFGNEAAALNNTLPCSGNTPSKLAFTAGKGTFVVGVSGHGDVPSRLSLTAASSEQS